MPANEFCDFTGFIWTPRQVFFKHTVITCPLFLFRSDFRSQPCFLLACYFPSSKSNIYISAAITHIKKQAKHRFGGGGWVVFGTAGIDFLNPIVITGFWQKLKKILYRGRRSFNLSQATEPIWDIALVFDKTTEMMYGPLKCISIKTAVYAILCDCVFPLLTLRNKKNRLPVSW